MGLLAKIFGAKDSASAGPTVQEVEVHFSYGSTNYQHLYALEDVIRHAIMDAAVGKYEGHHVSVDGSEGFYYLYGPDAEAIYRVISPVLASSTFMSGATVTLWFGPRKWRTPKRVIQLPA
jgi:N12 class adenine-specific DNA methylase